MIYKLQRPIASSDPNQSWLAYPRDTRKMIFIPIHLVSKEVRAMMGHDYKIYVHANLHPDGTLEIKSRATTQEW